MTSNNEMRKFTTSLQREFDAVLGGLRKISGAYILYVSTVFMTSNNEMRKFTTSLQREFDAVLGGLRKISGAYIE